MEYTDFGKKLKELRDKKSDTQQALASILSVGIKQIQRYEAGELLPTHENINQLIKRYNYDFTSLIYDIPERNLNMQNANEYIDKYIREKEARRLDAEARLDKSDRDKERLFNLLEKGLASIGDTQSLILAHERAWFDFHAEELAQGDEKKEKALKAKLSRLVGERKLGKLPKDKKQVPGN